MARYPTFGMEDFDSDMKKYVKMIVESLGEHQGRIRVQYKMSKDEIRILFNNPSSEEIVLIVKRDIDRVRFYMPVRPIYKSVDEITRTHLKNGF